MLCSLFLFLLLSAISIPPDSDSEHITWFPSVPHTLVLFDQPFPPNLIIDVITSTGFRVERLTESRQPFGVNFGVNGSLRLYFVTRPPPDWHFRFFEPSLVPDQYLVSTLPYDDFVVASPGVCLRSDYPPTFSNRYGYIFLQLGTYNVSIFKHGIVHGDVVKYRISRLAPQTFVGEDIPLGLELSGFSEWRIQFGQSDEDRALSLSFDSVIKKGPRYPPYREFFTKDSTLRLLLPPEQNITPNDPRCAADPQNRPPLRPRRNSEPLATATASVSEIPATTSPATPSEFPATRTISESPSPSHPPVRLLQPIVAGRPTQEVVLVKISFRTLFSIMGGLAIGAIAVGAIMAHFLFPPAQGSDTGALLPKAGSESGNVWSAPGLERTGMPDTYGIPIVGTRRELFETV
jgi:hypothetical protein